MQPTPAKNGSARFFSPLNSARKGHGNAVVKIVIGALCCMIIVGIIFASWLSPGDGIGGPSANSILSQIGGSGDPALERILLQEAIRYASSSANDLPDWNAELWTPIDIDVSSDPMVVLCKLDFRSHWLEPHNSPMFRDLVGISGCVGKNRKREKLSVLLEDIKARSATPEGRVVPPTGFVFHESRVGSTLVANMLATDPWALVFSESTPIANAIMHCDQCSHQRKIQLFRDVLTLMGRSPFHKKLFVKFQSITSTKMEVALEAFPDTPWAFVFRQPVQTIMSHLDPKKGNTGAAPCLRSKRLPPQEVRAALADAEYKGSDAGNEAWCAAHLSMLCQSALHAFEKFNATRLGGPRGMLVNYDSLPGAVPKALLPLFGQDVSASALERLVKESQPYSKSRGSRSEEFDGDSADKDQRATESIKLAADRILQQSYAKMDALAAARYREILQLDATATVEWSDVKTFSSPSPLRARALGEVYPHSTAAPALDYQSWLPFGNRHTSHPVERVECPLLPPAGYPKEFKMVDILKNWNADSTEIPPLHYDSLCHFDYRNASQVEAAYAYRAKEVPFVLYNIPELDEVVKKWSDVRYISRRLGNKRYRTETSKDNHFMYWSGGKRGGLKDWAPPTSTISSTFQDWLKVAVEGQNKSLHDRVHQYFRASSDAGNPWLYDELPFFKPKRSMFIVEPREQRGIHCRFGMRSVIAEAHFDGSRNFVAMVFGLRRWVLTHPNQCKHMHMFQRPHPSARHSAVDWSNPDTAQFPNFQKVMGNEVILQPGDMLFVPTVWIHFIVSLNVNVQCNTRSGIFHGYEQDLKECGF